MRLKIVFIFAFLILFNLGTEGMESQILSERQQDITLIASNTAKGDMNELKNSIIQALDGKRLTVNAIKEILVQMYAYCGFPRSLNGITAFLEVINERKNLGIEDELGEEGKILPMETDKNKYGEEVRTELMGMKMDAPYARFVPVIDDYLKEHLFADIFARGVLSRKEREIATIAALASRKGVEAQRNGHIAIGKNIGLTQTQIDEILKIASTLKNPTFGLGQRNNAYAKYFKGQSYLNILTKEGVMTCNVTFEPGCRNNWHIHHGGGQILLCTDGRGYYQEWGKPAQELHPGDVVNIPAETKHWHGAAKDSWFTHIAIAVPAENATTEWLEEVSDEEYNKLH